MISFVIYIIMKSFIQLKQELLESRYTDKMSRVAGIAQHRFGTASNRVTRIVNRINRRVADSGQSMSDKNPKNIHRGKIETVGGRISRLMHHQSSLEKTKEKNKQPESDVHETIIRRGNHWVVMNQNKTKTLGVHVSKEKAQRQLTAIEINKQKKDFGENVSYLGKKPSLAARNTLLGKIIRKSAGWEASMASDEEGHRQKEFKDQHERLKKLHTLLRKRKE